MAVRDNYPTMPVSPSISTDVETQQSSQVGGSAFPLDEDIGRDAVVPSPRRDPPQVVNVKIESHQRDNDPSTSSSFVSAASSTSRPASTRETEVDFTIKDTLSVAKTSPAATEPATNSGEATTPNVPAIARTPQEITLAELKAQKAAMLAALAALPAIQVLMEENAASDVGCGSDDEPTESDIMTAANKIVKDHIKLLHEYNELKDVGQGLMGLIADQRGVRIIEIQEEFGIEAND
ncbi:Swi5-domain-containing protein [Phaeosphaeria sp. MPI-PUGE-AT-0046c]|nr:Swi5-domain-containing protein [Phaeosphaeria sp. MPI-PUGE-AT-0046c]